MKAARVLLVDDNEDNLEILTVILRQTYDVFSYAGAQAALAALQAARPDLLLLDIAMAPIDGLQCLEAIRAMPGHAGTPAIALTACAGDAERRAFLSAGFQAVVTKPVLDHGELFATINALLTAGAVPIHDRAVNSPRHDQSGMASHALTGSTGERMIISRGSRNPATSGSA